MESSWDWQVMLQLIRTMLHTGKMWVDLALQVLRVELFPHKARLKP